MQVWSCFCCSLLGFIYCRLGKMLETFTYRCVYLHMLLWTCTTCEAVSRLSFSFCMRALLFHRIVWDSKLQIQTCSIRMSNELCPRAHRLALFNYFICKTAVWMFSQSESAAVFWRTLASKSFLMFARSWNMCFLSQHNTNTISWVSKELNFYVEQPEG